ncbi:hypothetical protein ACHAXS_011613 [Conticribra weissflogii]
MKDSGADKPKTVKFNVGGKKFEASRELVEENEESMLARMVSDTWQEDPTKPVFIDRDYDIFSSVLGYLRYGSIVLPNSIDRDMFLRDMDFYGIVHTYGTVKTSLATNAVGLMNSLQEAELKRDMTLVADYCC